MKINCDSEDKFLLEFGEWLSGEMKSRGYKQIDLARKSGVSRSQLCRILNGGADGITLGTLLKLLTFLGYRLDIEFVR